MLPKYKSQRDTTIEVVHTTVQGDSEPITIQEDSEQQVNLTLSCRSIGVEITGDGCWDEIYHCTII
jgi:hypothetical protein